MMKINQSTNQPINQSINQAIYLLTKAAQYDDDY